MKYRIYVFIVLVIAIVLILSVAKGFAFFDKEKNETASIVEEEQSGIFKITLVENTQLCNELSSICKAHSNACDDLSEDTPGSLIRKSSCLTIGTSCYIVSSSCFLTDGKGISEQVKRIVNLINEFWEI